MMGYSKKCSNLTTHWNAASNSCVSCGSVLEPGREFSPNCGVDDRGGRREAPTRKCVNNTFNDGRHEKCRPCTECKPGYQIMRLCNATADTECCQQGKTCSGDFTKLLDSTEKPHTALSLQHNGTALWAVPVILGITFVMLIIAIHVYLNYRRKKGLCFRRLDTGTMTTGTDKNLDDFLTPQNQLAPLQTVLDNLDVLEELVILLDPDRPTVKNTRHLASRCSFPFTWVTYAYSMKDTKSPLKAVLEGVTTKHPDWTVGHLGELLLDMRRFDALEVLTKLELKEELV